MEKPKVIVICGPTASGKTDLSIKLAQKINGEIISCDSMQIYKDMNIGTAKVTKEEMQDIKHYLVDYVDPTERYNVSRYKKDAIAAIEEILAKGKVPIVVGGTGLYINSLVYGIDYPEIETDLNYREELEKRAEENGLDSLYEEACKIDGVAMEKISRNDKKRIIRILEIYKETGKTKTEIEKESRSKENPYNFYTFAIDFPREVLYERINKRVDIMIEQGLVEETKYLLEKYGESLITSMQAIGYKELVPYIKNEESLDAAIDRLKEETRHYAKRQITWFKRIENIIWINGLSDKEENVDFIIKRLNT